MSDAGSNFISDKLKKILLNPEHRASTIIIIPSPKQWTGASMNQIHKVYYQKCIDTKSDIHLALLHIRSTPLWSGLPSPPPTMLSFNYPIRGIIPIINRPPANSNNNKEQYEALVKRQTKNDKNDDTSRNYASFPLGYIVVVQW